MAKEFCMYGIFGGYNDWENQVIQSCLNFKKKYHMFPNSIEVNIQTMIMMDVSCEQRSSTDIDGEDIVDEEGIGCIKMENEEIEGCRMNYYGTDDYGIPTFDTNCFTLKFFDGEKLEQDYYILRFGELPDPDDGEEIPEIYEDEEVEKLA